MYQGHDDRCPICRAERSGLSIASNGHRNPGVPVHERREQPVSLAHFMFGHDAEGADEGIHYVSVIARPGTDDVFNSIEEMLGAAEAAHGISRSMTSRTRAIPPGLAHGIRNALDRQTAEAHLARAIAAIHEDSQISAAIEGLRNPAQVPLGTFIDRVRRAPTTQTRRQGGHAGFAERRDALAASRGSRRSE